MWNKYNNFEAATHAPLVWMIPGVTDRPESRRETRELIEFVDIFPTLVEAAGLPSIASCDENEPWSQIICTEGGSFYPLITQDSASIETDDVWKKQYAFRKLTDRLSSYMR